MNGLKKAAKGAFLLTFGGICYGLIEMIYRGRTHYSMVIAGGICFAAIVFVDDRLGGRLSLITLSLIGGLIITSVELIFGAVFNLWLGMGVWDYSSTPLNLFGQVCLPFSLIWVAISAGAIIFNRLVLKRAFSI